MTTQRYLIALVALCVLPWSLAAGKGGEPKAERMFNGTPLAGAFYENRGQVVDETGSARPELRYYAFYNGARVYFTATGWHTVYQVMEEEGVSEATGARSTGVPMREHERGERLRQYRMDVTLRGCNKDVEIEALDPLPCRMHHYLAHCPDGITVPAHGMLRYRNIYDNIDLILYAAREGLKYEFEVRPGGKVEDIRLLQSGMDAIATQEDGSLRVLWPRGYTRESRPYSYVAEDGQHRSVATTWSVRDNELRFAVEPHDERSTLVIDPWSTFIGGHSVESILALDCDSVDALLAAGFTRSFDFPIKRAWQVTPWLSPAKNPNEMILLKFDSDEQLLWSTFYGGSLDDWPTGLSVDPQSNVLVVGVTSSENFPVHRAYQASKGDRNDAYLVKFDSSGRRIWATYFGADNEDQLNGVDCDSRGNVYAVGVCLADGSGYPTHIPLLRPFQSTGTTAAAMYLKMDSAGTLLFSSLLGGSGGDNGNSVAVYPSGEFVLCGFTGSLDFPTIRAQQATTPGQCFVTKIDSVGMPIWSTYLGGSGSYELATSVALDPSGRIWIAGVTTSTDFPLSRPFQSRNAGGIDMFLCTYDSSGSLSFSTYYGGTADERTKNVRTDSQGGVYVTSVVNSLGTPVYNAQYAVRPGGQDAFVLKFDTTRQRQWATYFGGSDNENCYALACDSRRYVYIGGGTESADLPVFNAYQDTITQPRFPNDPRAQDAYITRIRHDGYIPVALAHVTAARVGGTVRLDWRSESEVNAHGYIIERRYENGGGEARSDWHDIGFVPSASQGMEGSDYLYIDSDTGAPEARIFYRLRMVDLDGSFAHSPVVEVAPLRAVAVAGFETAYPSPARDWLTLRFTLPAESRISLIVHDIGGRELVGAYRDSIVPAGVHSVAIPVREWQSGLYLCTLTTASGSITRRVMVMR